MYKITKRKLKVKHLQLKCILILLQGVFFQVVSQQCCFLFHLFISFLNTHNQITYTSYLQTQRTCDLTKVL